MASLHLWLTLVRLRAEGDAGKRLGQARPPPKLARIARAPRRAPPPLPRAAARSRPCAHCAHPPLPLQEVYDHFWADMEVRVRAEGVVVRLGKWMKELEQSFYGSSAAYDAALAPDAPPGALQAALRRNVFMGEGTPADAARAARYVRHQLACLALTPSEAVMAGAWLRAAGAAARRVCRRAHASTACCAAARAGHLSFAPPAAGDKA